MTAPAFAPSEDALRDFYEALGARLSVQRMARGITQAELADAVGLARTSVTNIEAGRQHPPVHVLVAMAQALGTELCVLVSHAPIADELPYQDIHRALLVIRDVHRALGDILERGEVP